MFDNYQLKSLRSSDWLEVREVYVDAIQLQAGGLYTKAQIQAWSSLGFLPGVLDKALINGQGWISWSNCDKEIVAFAIRYPLDRLALLYCRSRFTRQGHATALLKRIYVDAKQDGQDFLSTEASSFSMPLFLKLGWTLIKPQSIEIAGVSFERYLMKVKLP